MAHSRLTYVVLLQRLDPIVAMIGKRAFDNWFNVTPPLAQIAENGAYFNIKPQMPLVRL
jgi:hypothetical protein